MNCYARLAQLIERFLAKEEARGLSPLSRTNESPGYNAGFFIGLGDLKSLPKGQGEKCQWHFARKASFENSFLKVKFRACRR